MSATPVRVPSRQDAAAANEAIRRYVRLHGARPWGPAERAELDRLRTAWLQAMRPAGARGLVPAAEETERRAEPSAAPPAPARGSRRTVRPAASRTRPQRARRRRAKLAGPRVRVARAARRALPARKT